MPRVRNVANSQPPPPAAQRTRQALKDTTNTTRSTAPVYDESTEKLVKDARSKRTQLKKTVQDEDQFIMAGGLGHRSDEQAVPPESDDNLARTVETTSKPNRRPPRTTRRILQTAAQSKVLEDMKKRMQAASQSKTSQDKAPAPTTSESIAPAPEVCSDKQAAIAKSSNTSIERSELSLSPSPPPANSNSIKPARSSLAQPGSAIRSHGTSAVENSILALKNFKRRPRQPSMLQMVQQRTASARPSAVNSRVNGDPSVYDVEDVEDDEEVFAPEAEGTPLHSSKTKSHSARAAKRTSSAAPTNPKKRKSDAVDSSLSSTEALSAKRHKSTETDGDKDVVLPLRQSPSRRRISQERDANSEVHVVNSSPASSPPPIQFTGVRKTPEPDVLVPSTEQERDNDRGDDFRPDRIYEARSGTMADPASSLPLSPDPISTQSTDIMADPMTQSSPQRKSTQPKNTKQKTLTTAALQSLLPKRRQPLRQRHRKSEYDIESNSDNDEPIDTSHLEENEDELGGRARPQKRIASTKRRKPAATKSKPLRSKAAPKPRKSTAPSVSKKPAKTYGRAGTTSDKENDQQDEAFEDLDENDESALPDTSISMIEAASSKDLEAARKKFAEIDDWDMEFESMSYEEGRSSSQLWR